MDVEDTEQLFLLEFLVDNVHISRSCSFVDKKVGAINTQLSTVFQFLKFPPLEVKEKTSQQKGDEPPSFKTGKSCLFAIPSKKLVEFSKLFNVNVSVQRRFPTGVLPEKRILGETTVDISSDFAYVVTEVLTNPQVIPKSQSLRESYRLRAAGSVPGTSNFVGSVSLFLRISCFGKLIVNEFQLSSEHAVSLVDGGVACRKSSDVSCGEDGAGGEAWTAGDDDPSASSKELSRVGMLNSNGSYISRGGGETLVNTEKDTEKKMEQRTTRMSQAVIPLRPHQYRGAPLAPVTAAAANVVRYDPLTRGLVLNLLQPEVAASTAAASGATMSGRMGFTGSGSIGGNVTGAIGGGGGGATGLGAVGYTAGSTAAAMGGVGVMVGGGGASAAAAGGSLPASREFRRRGGSDCQRSPGRSRPATQPVARDETNELHLGSGQGQHQPAGGRAAKGAATGRAAGGPQGHRAKTKAPSREKKRTGKTTRTRG